MSHNSQNRTRYFDAHIRNQPTAEQYLIALAQSPYNTHKRMAVLLEPELHKLVRQAELDAFEKTLKQ